MKLLVTGGAGFIGSNFIRHVLTEHPDDRVVNLDKLTYAGNPANLADLERRPALRVRAGRHLRRQARARRGARGGRGGQLRRRDRTSTARSWTPTRSSRPTSSACHVLLEAVRELGRRACCTSAPTRCTAPSRAARLRETAPLRPTNPYSAAKAGGDLLALAYWHTHGVPVVITRSSNNFGPYQYPEKVVPLFVTNALEDRPLPLYGDGRQVRDWLYVLDNCAAIDLVLRRGPRRRDLQHRRRPRGREPRPHPRDPAADRQARDA